MNEDLTINGLTFTRRFNGEKGSERRETSRGVTLPEILTIATRPYVDSASKRAGVETKLRVDRHVELADGTIGVVSKTDVVRYPSDSGVATADILAVVERLRTIVAPTEAAAGLGLGEDIFVDKDQ